MKRILFYYDSYCGGESHGGTEVATSRIARALQSTGKWEVYNACKRRRDSLNENLYAGVKVLRNRANFISDLADFIRENEIDVMVNMGRFYRQHKLKKAIATSGRDVKLMFMHHFAPGSESRKHTYAAGWHLLKLEPLNPGYWVRGTVYPLFKLQRRLWLSRMYRKILEESDGVVLLSAGYKTEYLRKAYGCKSPTGAAENEGKFFAIPNIYDPKEKLGELKKEKRVLVLSRMDEIQKRISLALRIWKKIEEETDLQDWTLDIVGSGHDARAVKKLAQKLGLKNVVFHGWQPSVEFLERSPILMMPSLYEGLSLSMIEAQSYGCIPIAYNSYASLSDIVTDGENGVIVEKFGDVEGFASKLASLMRDDEKRAEMSVNAIRKSNVFSSEKVARKWLAMLDIITS